MSSETGSSSTLVPAFIQRVEVKELFGRYDYVLEPPPSGRLNPSLLLMYGENGSGKTTILSLVYHLLSKEPSKGHRTFLAKTRFAQLKIHMSDGTILNAYREGSETIGSFWLSATKEGHNYSFFYKVDEEGAIPSLAEHEEHTKFLSHLPELTLYFLRDDRKISTEIELEEREITRRLESKYFNRLATLSGELDVRPVARTASLLTKVVEWAREQALAASNRGQLNVNTIYSEIVAHLVGPTTEKRPLQSPDELARTLAEQAVRTHKYSRYGLTSELEVGTLVDSLLKGKTNESRGNVIAQILEPFIDGNEARLRALEPIQRTFETFVTSVNSFYTDKTLTFSIRDGIRIVTENGETLAPGSLSSGEKQLLILFCNVIMVGRKPVLFLIDEPELSLNIKWQRQLIDALLSCVQNGTVQFVLATHSLQILSRHRDSLVRLQNLHPGSRFAQESLFDDQDFQQ
jgi:energy-coupling factor transporter ATP-binding protein EcfA2